MPLAEITLDEYWHLAADAEANRNEKILLRELIRRDQLKVVLEIFVFFAEELRQSRLLGRSRSLRRGCASLKAGDVRRVARVARALEDRGADDAVLTVLSVADEYLLLNRQRLVRTEEPVLLLIREIVFLRNGLLTCFAIARLLVLTSHVQLLIAICHVRALDNGGAPLPVVAHLFLHHGLDNQINEVVDDLLAHIILLSLQLAVCQLRNVLIPYELRGVALGDVVLLIRILLNYVSIL